METQEQVDLANEIFLEFQNEVLKLVRFSIQAVKAEIRQAPHSMLFDLSERLSVAYPYGIGLTDAEQRQQKQLRFALLEDMIAIESQLQSYLVVIETGLDLIYVKDRYPACGLSERVTLEKALWLSIGEFEVIIEDCFEKNPSVSSLGQPEPARIQGYLQEHLKSLRAKHGYTFSQLGKSLASLHKGVRARLAGILDKPQEQIGTDTYVGKLILTSDLQMRSVRYLVLILRD